MIGRAFLKSIIFSLSRGTSSLAGRPFSSMYMFCVKRLTSFWMRSTLISSSSLESQARTNWSHSFIDCQSSLRKAKSCSSSLSSDWSVDRLTLERDEKSVVPMYSLARKAK